MHSMENLIGREEVRVNEIPPKTRQNNAKRYVDCLH